MTIFLRPPQSNCANQDNFLDSRDDPSNNERGKVDAIQGENNHQLAGQKTDDHLNSMDTGTIEIYQYALSKGTSLRFIDGIVRLLKKTISMVLT